MAMTEWGMGANETSETDGPPSRQFSDENGVVWTAELRRPRTTAGVGRVASPMILFYCDTRACLATLRSPKGLGDLTEEDLQRHLHACLSG